MSTWMHFLVKTVEASWQYCNVPCWLVNILHKHITDTECRMIYHITWRCCRRLSLHFKPKRRNGISRDKAWEKRLLWRLAPRRHVGLYQNCQFYKEVVRFFTKKKKDRFEDSDHKILWLLTKKRSTNYAHLVQPILNWNGIQRNVRVIQDVWLSSLIHLISSHLISHYVFIHS